MKLRHWTRRELGRLALGTYALCGRSLLGNQTASDFSNPPDSAKMLFYYWWFGPSQTESQVSKELKAIQHAGGGGVFIFPVYPLTTDDRVNYPYLSEQFLRLLRSAGGRASQLSLTVDLLGGGGWPFGGPSIPLDKSSRTLRRVAEGTPLREAEMLVAVDDDRGFAFISSPTRQRVKTSVIGGQGWVLDHLNRAEVERYLENVVAKLVSAFPPGGLRSINFDSLEAFGQFWTPDFPSEFRRRRGYDLLPHLAAIWEDIGETTPHVRYDYWRTLTDLYLDSFQRPFYEWCKRHHFPLQGKPMGTPVNDLRAFAYQDLAVGEEYDWLEFTGPRWAASGAHIYGQNLVGNEAYTWLRQPRYLATLQDVKVGSDLNFLAGVNVLIAHGFPYSPDDTGTPGWSFYAAVYFHPKNTWWPYFPFLLKYVQRVSYVLREGVQVNDIAVLLPEDDEMADCAMGQLMRDGQKVMVKLRLSGGAKKLPQFGLADSLKNRSPLVSAIVTNGYSFDGVNNEAIQRANIENGRLQIGLGNYGVLVLPSIKGMPVETMEKISRFVRAGGRVIAIGTTPSLCYGLQNWQANSARVRELSASLFKDKRTSIVSDAGEAFVGALRVAHPPDINFEHADPDVGFVHRRSSTHDFYFIANTSPEQKQLRSSFRVGHRVPELWDPMTGNKSLVTEYFYDETGTAFTLVLEPYASTIVAFSRRETFRPQRRVRLSTPSPLPPALPVRAPWRLEIDGKSLQLDSLQSWTQYEQFKFFQVRLHITQHFISTVLTLMTDWD